MRSVGQVPRCARWGNGGAVVAPRAAGRFGRGTSECFARSFVPAAAEGS
jgi:hypothetical protein